MRRHVLAYRGISARQVLLAGCLVAIIFTVGIYDWLTWGTPFSSSIKFAHLTLVAPDFASRVKYQAPWWYLANLVRWCSPLLLPLLWYRAPQPRDLVPRHSAAGVLRDQAQGAALPAGDDSVSLHRRCDRIRVDDRSDRRIAIALVAISLMWDLHGLATRAEVATGGDGGAVDASESHRSTPSPLSQLWAYGDRLYLGDRWA